VSFWAKGGTNLTVSLQNGTPEPFGTVGVSNVWKYYKLGPVAIPGNNLNNPRLIFGADNNDPFFVDNVQFTKVRDLTYLVKKTLGVPDICDSNNTDNLPGEALGCSEYAADSGAGASP
jgi:hypothetical protein